MRGRTFRFNDHVTMLHGPPRNRCVHDLVRVLIGAIGAKLPDYSESPISPTLSRSVCRSFCKMDYLELSARLRSIPTHRIPTHLDALADVEQPNRAADPTNTPRGTSAPIVDEARASVNALLATADIHRCYNLLFQFAQARLTLANRWREWTELRDLQGQKPPNLRRTVQRTLTAARDLNQPRTPRPLLDRAPKRAKRIRSDPSN
jgi:hypothetical protein